MRKFYNNGYGISIINSAAWGGEGMEIAVLKGDKNDFHICYATPITSDVIGGLTWDQVDIITRQVSEL